MRFYISHDLILTVSHFTNFAKSVEECFSITVIRTYIFRLLDGDDRLFELLQPRPHESGEDEGIPLHTQPLPATALVQFCLQAVMQLWKIPFASMCSDLHIVCRHSVFRNFKTWLNLALLWIYPMYPFGKEPIGSFCIGEVYPEKLLDKPFKQFQAD